MFDSSLHLQERERIGVTAAWFCGCLWSVSHNEEMMMSDRAAAETAMGNLLARNSVSALEITSAGGGLQINVRIVISVL